MRLIRSIKGMSLASCKIKERGKSIGFVPTMGALHKGHLSLIRRARKDNDFVVVSIFVNPTQFSPQEDFKRYPRPIKKDIAICRKAGVDFVFYPEAGDMYPAGFKTYAAVEDLSSVLCGRSRTGHFRGVTTVVAKLFNIVQPNRAYFGQKDAQQAAIIKRMTEDLNFPIQIKVMPTFREKDGLAMSSRNIYLNQREKKDALVLIQALKLAKALVRRGIKDTKRIISRMRQVIAGKKNIRIDYISIVDLNELKPVKRICGSVLVALAVFIGKTRLIDNAIIKNA
jgi:pantoate--beta-alanine ligase